nr:glycosyltransferase [Kibdelosporangium sp. MJ126-NF4]CEL18615.1 Glycosyltransferase fused to TPR-repeat domain [Kibdelosporangium sp. MJ126-NF4]CTQ98100.1 Glycosyltransferase fused to TPR-repeat domain [Kibdelosporangium sp. MJ126-NF4]
MSLPITVVVLARDEERCIARCLDSVTGRGFDRVLVVDSGSVDRTMNIVDDYRRHGVESVRVPWPGSFAELRNHAIDLVETGWIVFLDADEWLEEQSADQLGPCLASLSAVQRPERLAFAPMIHHPDSSLNVIDLPRVFLADSGIRYRGALHEYPVLPGTNQPPDLVGLDIWFQHDGYLPEVAIAKNKMDRNLALLRTARDDDPDNPRWLYYVVKDGLPTLSHTQLIDICTELRVFAERDMPTGDRRTAREYYRLALCEACQGLAVVGDWDTVRRYSDEMGGPDAHYYHAMAELITDAPDERDLLDTIRLRRDEKWVSTSNLCTSGRHLDALIVSLLARFRGASAAERYRELCLPWSDVFFAESAMRTYLWEPYAGSAARRS